MKFIPIYLFMLQSPADFNYIPIIVIVVLVVLFLIGREIFCWYYKINERIELQKETNKLQTETNHLLKKMIGIRDINIDSNPTFDKKTFNYTNPNRDNIIGESIKIENLEIAQFDIPNLSIWNESVIACLNLGEGWRLPTKEELNILYLNKSQIGNFTDFSYWSSTEKDKKYASSQGFYAGSIYSTNKDESNYARAIRTIK